MRKAIADADGGRRGHGLATWCGLGYCWPGDHEGCMHGSQRCPLLRTARLFRASSLVPTPALLLWMEGVTWSTCLPPLAAELELPMKDLEEAWLGGTKQVG